MTTLNSLGDFRLRVLPHTQIFNYYKPDGGPRMEFRLIYRGQLPPEKCKDTAGVLGSGAVGRATEKHRLRKEFHRQLRELWNQHPSLKIQANSYFRLHDPGDDFPYERQFASVGSDDPRAKKYLDWIADSHIRCNGDRFVPLVSEASGFTCSLDILFLRRDN